MLKCAGAAQGHLRAGSLLFHNLGRKKFEGSDGAGGRGARAGLVARGAAYADFDRDGDLDLLISTNGSPAYLYRNDGGNANHWLRVKLASTKSNRDGMGAVGSACARRRARSGRRSTAGRATARRASCR